jgi:hypothetical protein
LADDVETQGDIATGLGRDERINVVIALSDDWILPGDSGQPHEIARNEDSA